MPTEKFHDVIVAGAGPVGLLLACELRLAGASVLVLEAAADSCAPLKQMPFGLRGLSAPSIAALHRRGLLDAIVAAQPAQSGQAPHWQRQLRRPGGHFAGMQFFVDSVDEGQWPHRLPSSVPTTLAVTMQSIEDVLAARAIALGAEIERGVAVDGFAQSGDGVTVGAGGQSFCGAWLVGCDGGRSVVRKAGGFDFVGTAPEFTGYSIEAEIADGHALQPGRHYTATGMYTFQPPGTFALVDFDAGAFHRSQPVTADHAQAVLARVSGVDVVLTRLIGAATWTDRAFQAGAYRMGRVVLAGDAAHIHSPLGGQGLNLGLGDAMNLGWKLAATVRGDAPDGVIDSYQAERHPVGAAVLDWSRAQVALMRPTPATRALAAVMRDLIGTRDGTTYMADRVWGMLLRVDLGGGHPLVGRGAPDFAFLGGGTVGELLRDGLGVLLDFDDCAGRREFVGRWDGRIGYVSGEVRDRLGLSAVLVRPDGVVAWVGEDRGDGAGLAGAASRWFGAV